MSEVKKMSHNLHDLDSKNEELTNNLQKIDSKLNDFNNRIKDQNSKKEFLILNIEPLNKLNLDQRSKYDQCKKDYDNIIYQYEDRHNQLKKMEDIQKKYFLDSIDLEKTLQRQVERKKEQMSGKCTNANVGTDINQFKYNDLRLIDEIQNINFDIIDEVLIYQRKIFETQKSKDQQNINKQINQICNMLYQIKYSKKQLNLINLHIQNKMLISNDELTLCMEHIVEINKQNNIESQQYFLEKNQSENNNGKFKDNEINDRNTMTSYKNSNDTDLSEIISDK